MKECKRCFFGDLPCVATTAKTFEPTKKENKSKKLLLLLKPTLHERLKTKAASFDMSINELVNQILEQNV